jgi:hypothetical protein
MNKKTCCQFIAVLTALFVAGIFLFCDFGLHLTPLTKFFVVFFGVILGLQCIPAVLLCFGMVKGLFSSSEAEVKQALR